MSSEGRNDAEESMEESACGDTEADLNRAICDLSATETQVSFPPSAKYTYRQPRNIITLDSISSSENSLPMHSHASSTSNSQKFDHDTVFVAHMEKLSLKLKQLPNPSKETSCSNSSSSTSTILAGNMAEPPGVHRTANPRVSSRNSTIVAGRLLSCDSIDSMDSPIEPSNSPFNKAINKPEDIELSTLSDHYTDSLENCGAKNKKKNTQLARCSVNDTITLSSDDEVQVVSVETSCEERGSDPKSGILRKQKERESPNFGILRKQILSSDDEVQVESCESDPKSGILRKQKEKDSMLDDRRKSPNFCEKVERILAENLENVDPQLGTAERGKPRITSIETVQIQFPVRKLNLPVRKCGVEKPRDSNFNISSDETRSTLGSGDYFESSCEEAEKMVYANLKTPSMKALRSINDCYASSPNIGVVHETFSSIDITGISAGNGETPDQLQRDKITHVPTTNPATMKNQLCQMNQALILSVLSNLDSSLSSPSRKGRKTPEKLFHRLSEEFKASPSSFTERLLTIIEESAIQANREPEVVDLDSFDRFRKSSNGIEDESMPEFAPSLCATGISGSTSRGLTIEEKEAELETPKTCILTPKQISTGQTFTITPGFERLAGSGRIYPRTPRRIFKSSSSDSQTPGTPGSPSAHHSANDSTASFLQWEAWCEEMCSHARAIPSKNVQEASNFRPSRLSELISIYERQAFMQDSIVQEPEDLRDQNVAEALEQKNSSHYENKPEEPEDLHDQTIAEPKQLKQKNSSYYENKPEEPEDLHDQTVAEPKQLKQKNSSYYENKPEEPEDLHDQTVAEPKQLKQKNSSYYENKPEEPEDLHDQTVAEPKQLKQKNSSYYEDDLEKSLLAEIAEKRRRCFNTAQIMLEITDEPKLGVEKAREESNDSGFLSTLSACTEYQTYINGKRNTLQTIIMRSKQFSGGLRGAPLRSLELTSKKRKLVQKEKQIVESTCCSGVNAGRKNLKGDRKNVAASLESLGRKSQRDGTSPCSAAKRTLRALSNSRAGDKSGSGEGRAKTTSPGLDSTATRSSSRPAASANSKSPSRPLRSPKLKLNEITTASSKTNQPQRTSTNVSHRRLQKRLATAINSSPIYNKTNTSSSNSPSSHFTQPIEKHQIPVLKVTGSTPEKMTGDTELSSYRDLQLGTPQSRSHRKKFFFTPGKSPTFGKVRQKPSRYFVAVQKTPTPERSGSRLQRVYRTQDSTRAVISPVAMYIKGTDAKLVKNVAISRNEMMLTPTRKRAKVRETATERLKFALSPTGGACLGVEEGGACENIASTHTGAGSATAEDNFKLPRVSYKPAPRVISLEKSSAVPQSQLMKGVKQSTVIRHAGRTKLANIEKIPTTENSATESLQHDSADASLHIEFPVKRN